MTCKLVNSLITLEPFNIVQIYMQWFIWNLWNCIKKRAFHTYGLTYPIFYFCHPNYHWNFLQSKYFLQRKALYKRTFARGYTYGNKRFKVFSCAQKLLDDQCQGNVCTVAYWHESIIASTHSFPLMLSYSRTSSIKLVFVM